MTTADEPIARRDATRALRVVVALVGALVLVVLAVVVYHVFVASLPGQRIDQSSLEGAHLGRSRIIGVALTVLGLVSAVGLVSATLGVVVIAVVRRRLDLAFGAAVLVVGSTVTSQVVKYAVVDRPQFGIDAGVHNSLPSGHATVAAALVAAGVLVVPPRARSWTAVGGVVAAALAGVSTLVAGWHRPSDVMAATLIVGAWAGLIAALLGLRSRSLARPPAERHTTLVVAAWIGLVGLAGLVAAGLAFTHVNGLSSIAVRHRDLFIAYAGGAAAITGTTAAVFAFVLAVFGSVGAARDRARRYGGVGAVAGDAVGTVASASASSTSTLASGS